MANKSVMGWAVAKNIRGEWEGYINGKKVIANCKSPNEVKGLLLDYLMGKLAG
jgi:hypothetical protein